MPGYEIVRKRADVDVQANGGYLEVTEVAYKVLTAQGRDALRQLEFSYTDGYQMIAVTKAYTLKPDGTKISVGPGAILFGHGATSNPGFTDLKTITVIFPSIEIGDQVVLQTFFRQTVPWFPNQFYDYFYLSRFTRSHDVRITLTAPASLALQIDANGVEGGRRETAGGKNFWVWTFENDRAYRDENGTVAEFDTGPRLVVSTFTDFGQVASAYRAVFEGKDEVTPEIRALAGSLTKGVSDRREQAHLLYDWVSSHIAYVSLVLGAGGFTPHEAGAVLAHKYGDCKDHVMLLQALLKAKGIDSSPVLIDAGTSFRLPTAASPGFDHLITFIPEFDIFADSTAQFAPFGALPSSDAGKPVVLVASGKIARTPAITASGYRLSAVSEVKYAEDGTMTGHTVVKATGSGAIAMRGSISGLALDGDEDYLRSFLGPGATGTLERGDPLALSQSYSFSADYRVANEAAFPGPAALTGALAYKPFSFTYLIGGDLPPVRSQSWICPSLTAEETVTVELPKGVRIVSLPESRTFKVPEISLRMDYRQLSPSKLRLTVRLQMDHPGPVCTPEYYNGVRQGLSEMIAALRKQIVYR